MKQQSYPMFDSTQVPDDLCPIATKMNPMLPGDWASMKPVVGGTEAAAWAVTLARVDMVAVYPITPQSSLVEYLAKFVADGKLNAEIVDVEGEHSVLSVLHGG